LTTPVHAVSQSTAALTARPRPAAIAPPAASIPRPTRSIAECSRCCCRSRRRASRSAAVIALAARRMARSRLVESPVIRWCRSFSATGSPPPYESHVDAAAHLLLVQPRLLLLKEFAAAAAVDLRRPGPRIIDE